MALIKDTTLYKKILRVLSYPVGMSSGRRYKNDKGMMPFEESMIYDVKDRADDSNKPGAVKTERDTHAVKRKRAGSTNGSKPEKKQKTGMYSTLVFHYLHCTEPEPEYEPFTYTEVSILKLIPLINSLSITSLDSARRILVFNKEGASGALPVFPWWHLWSRVLE